MNSQIFIVFLLIIIPYNVADYIDDVIKPLLSPSDSIETCKNYNNFMFNLFKECPKVNDKCCMSKYMHESDYKSTLSCSLVGPFENNSLHILTSKEFLKLVSLKDACGRPWCMASLMYSKSCIFSARVAERFHELAALFPNIFVVAVDVSERDSSVDSLINQYGISATPVIALWENGLPRFKITREPDFFDSLVLDVQAKSGIKTAKNWTSDKCVNGDCMFEKENVILVNKSNALRQKFIVDEQLQQFDWYLLISVIGIILQGLYLFEYKRQGGIPWRNLEIGF